MKKPLVIIAGPTACGKTDTSIMLAKKINGEIISADSMQVYKFMDIGTAKVTPQEMDGVKHYLIDELMPDEEFNAMIFQQKAKKYIEEIYSKGKIPIIVGGTGFYINALVYDNDFMSTDNDLSIRNKLMEEVETNGEEFVYEKLKAIDPEYASIVHHNNVKRVVRALEYYFQTGEKMSQHNSEAKQRKSPYDVSFVVLNMEREKLYERINLRVDIMIKNGLLDEVKQLLDMGYSPNLVSMQGLGYKEFVPYFNGEATLEAAIEELKQGTRHFAKRQLTWFRRQSKGLWIDLTSKDKTTAVQEIVDYINSDKESDL
ncbi:MAG: tRNA (adenosine(37)-N6)-dimethylallyltransferase MiaA [Lachnospiraceae bacterium]|nr:tRNA (adenosine(37)-N6)-dimethylallyltransferase MiaA [Lachnospiraceae bacterium]